MIPELICSDFGLSLAFYRLLGFTIHYSRPEELRSDKGGVIYLVGAFPTEAGTDSPRHLEDGGQSRTTAINVVSVYDAADQCQAGPQVTMMASRGPCSDASAIGYLLNSAARASASSSAG